MTQKNSGIKLHSTIIAPRTKTKMTSISDNRRVVYYYMSIAEKKNKFTQIAHKIYLQPYLYGASLKFFPQFHTLFTIAQTTDLKWLKKKVLFG